MQTEKKALVELISKATTATAIKQAEGGANEWLAKNPDDQEILSALEKLEVMKDARAYLVDAEVNSPGID
jgi:ActR/RegA family two-component response regulator